jgi:hypothetical protein
MGIQSSGASKVWEVIVDPLKLNLRMFSIKVYGTIKVYTGLRPCVN